jgi:glycosyltransferase involved in cell wall biosynthesis
MIRVAFINHHGGTPGGGERGLEAFLRRIPSDVDPYVFLFEDGAFAEQLRSLDIPLYVVPASRRLMSVTRDTIRSIYAIDCIRQVLSLHNLLRSNDIDVVLTNSMKAHIVGALAARLCGIPVVTWLKDLPEGLALKLVRTISRSCARVRITCSRAVARRLALGRTTVLLPPLELAHADPAPSRIESRSLLGLPKDKLIFSVVGRIAQWKGQDRFIRAAARASEQTDAIHFAIVGSPTFPQDQDFASELAPLAMRLGIAHRISFIPWLENLGIAYAASDLICNTSAAEPFGRTSAEAAAYGVPTLCFDDGGACEAVVPTVSGTVVPAGDVEALAAAMVAYATNPAALRRAGAAARAYVQRHNADHLAIVFFDLIRRASSRNGVGNGDPSSARASDVAIPVLPASPGIQ